ncbi:MAG: DUF3450 family protein, partial [Paraglaciecola sp.]|nr:DUF3450 family protein [Paraglaciecola sp.]
LTSNLARADISVAEKYRKIIEAYQIEIEYGKTLEAYRGQLNERQVTFVKIGRLALFYQTLDQRETGVWNINTSLWQLVEDGEIIRSVNLATKIARKQQAPELLLVLAQGADVTP